MIFQLWMNTKGSEEVNSGVKEPERKLAVSRDTVNADDLSDRRSTNTHIPRIYQGMKKPLENGWKRAKRVTDQVQQRDRKWNKR